MTYTNSVGAPAYYPTYQAQAPMPTYAAAPTQAYGNDAYQARYGAQPMAPAAQKEPYAIVNKGDMMLGVAGAVGGFFLAGMIGLTGPIGALILGLGLLATSVVVRAIKHSQEQKQPQQMQAVHSGFQQNYQYQPQYQQYYAPSQTSMAPQPTGATPYNGAYGQVAAPTYAAPSYPAAPAQQSGWDKFLSWL